MQFCRRHAIVSPDPHVAGYAIIGAEIHVKWWDLLTKEKWMMTRNTSWEVEVVRDQDDVKWVLRDRELYCL